ncbi:peptidoglycan-binding protein LysM [Streptomyces hydrogenans]|uniref:peptidoglycan-binding protein LysM n=1 Tax=Streptomyces hydrogenans TaxID=1873719 RepID=UPI0038280F7D
MALFSFVKEAGERVADLLTPGNLLAEERLKSHIAGIGLGNPNISAHIEGDKVVVKGEVDSQDEREKVILATGNIAGVASVDDQIVVTGPAASASRFVAVEPGDTLSSIAKNAYGDASKYNKIFEGNKPMLRNPEMIYPGMVLRVPE